MTITKKVTQHYVDNQKFYTEILAHKQRVKDALEAGKEPPRLPEYIGECIYKIATKLSLLPKFLNYSYREEMISDGIENCILYFDDYDPNRGTNPFAYFTQVIYFAFIRRINKEEKNRYIIYKNFQHTIIHGSPNGHSGHGPDNNMSVSDMFDSDDMDFTPKIYDNINDFMYRFEKKEAEKKAKRKETKEGLLQFYEEDTDEQPSTVSS